MKECQIINGQFSWFLCVDDQEIPFQHASNVDYFKNHYETLGYKVEIIKDRIQ